MTFCLRELRAILSFAEAFTLELKCHMEGNGQPVLFSLDKEHSYSADFLLATLSASADATPSSAATLSHRDAAPLDGQSPLPMLRNQSTSKSLSRAFKSPSLAPNTPDHFARVNSLSLLDVNPPGPGSTATELNMSLEPPAKRARARHIFQRCLLPSQDISMHLGEVLAPDSDNEDAAS